MCDLQKLQLHMPGAFTGDFRMRDVSINETKDGRQYVQFMLEDMTASVPAYVWREELQPECYLPDYSLVRVSGKCRYHDEQLKVDIHSLIPIEQKRPGDVLRLIPLSLCPQPALLTLLQASINRITNTALRCFVESVLANDSIAFHYITAPGSLKYHHDYAGGLLKHSLEGFAMVERFSELPQDSYEIGLVAMLFHDIGKILTLSSDMQCTSLGSCMDHDKLTLEVLAPYLKQLGEDWPDGALELRYALTWKLKKPVPRYNVADVVACCDRLSAGLDRQSRA